MLRAVLKHNHGIAMEINTTSKGWKMSTLWGLSAQSFANTQTSQSKQILNSNLRTWILESLLYYFFIRNAVSCFTIARVSRELKWFREWQSNPLCCSWYGREIPFTRGYNLSPKQGYFKLNWKGEFCTSAPDLYLVYLPQKAACPSFSLLLSMLCKTQWFSSRELTVEQE